MTTANEATLMTAMRESEDNTVTATGIPETIAARGLVDGGEATILSDDTDQYGAGSIRIALAQEGRIVS